MDENPMRWQMTVQDRFFISSLPPHVRRLAQVVRSHWGVENSLHWVLDVVFEEDLCRIRQDQVSQNFALI